MQRIGPFDAARSILGGASRTPLRERYELFFTDYSLLPLLVHQNYLSSLMHVDPAKRTDITAAASAAVSDADIISGKMRRVFFLVGNRSLLSRKSVESGGEADWRLCGRR